jgi:hypothetical protein
MIFDLIANITKQVENYFQEKSENLDDWDGEEEHGQGRKNKNSKKSSSSSVKKAAKGTSSDQFYLSIVPFFLNHSSLTTSSLLSHPLHYLKDLFANCIIPTKEEQQGQSSSAVQEQQFVILSEGVHLLSIMEKLSAVVYELTAMRGIVASSANISGKSM